MRETQIIQFLLQSWMSIVRLVIIFNVIFLRSWIPAADLHPFLIWFSYLVFCLHGMFVICKFLCYVIVFFCCFTSWFW